MKRLFQASMIILLVSLFFSISNAAEYTISIGTSATSGTTTAVNGVSTMCVNYAAGVTAIYIANSKGDCVIQLKDALNGLTISQDQIVKGGFNSGTSLTALRYRESVVNDQKHWDKSQTVDIWSGMLFSGNTPYQIKIYPTAMGWIQFEVVSGITPLGRADFIFEALD